MLRDLADLRGEALIARVLALVDQYRPLHLSIVGGEPLVRHGEVSALLPQLARRKIEVQIVTSAVRPIPPEWDTASQLVVSIDGLREQHDARRAPATYDRILRHIEGRQIIVHCTITRQMLRRDMDLREFSEFWSARPEVRRVWFSLYTPQAAECSAERLLPGDRERAVAELTRLRKLFPKLHMPDVVLRGYLEPPQSPEACLFARATQCLSADLATPITPCQFGGNPVCSECGCMASAGLASVANYRIAGLIQIGAIFDLSRKWGRFMGAGSPRVTAV